MTPTPPSLTEEQKNRLAQRLSMMSHDRADVGQGLPRTARALAQGDEWLPAWRDEALRELLLAEASAACPAIVDLAIVYAGDGLTRVVVTVDRVRFAQGEDASSMKDKLAAALNAVGAHPRLIASADRVEIAPVLR